MKRLLPLVLLLAGCSSPDPAPSSDASKPAEDASFAATTTSRHPYAKHIELAGFRLRESKPGKIEIQFAAINHSPADLGDVSLKVNLHTANAAAGDPPVATFEATVPKWGPLEVKDVSATADSKLRVYELPDWQFLRATFEITSPTE